jgi:hypothetical protein
VMPHPSGLNRKLNDKQFVADAVAMLRSYCLHTSEIPIADQAS